MRKIPLVLILLMGLGTLAGLVATYKRLHVEGENRRVEIALEWEEVSKLAETAQLPIQDVLARFKAEGVTTLVLAEDTVANMEQVGALQPTRQYLPDGSALTVVTAQNPLPLQRIESALALRGREEHLVESPVVLPVSGGTRFEVEPETSEPIEGGETPAKISPSPSLTIPMDYLHLRSLGLGLPPEGVAAAKAAQLQIAGRISNFPGVTTKSALAVLQSLKAQGASVVIFTGEEVLGYRGLEKSVAEMFRDPQAPPLPLKKGEAPIESTGLIYGAVEFGKQKGDDLLSSALHGDYVRVHSIQTTEMAQINAEEVIDRFTKAARERNIRFCYLRLFTFAGQDTGKDPVTENVEMLAKIRRGMLHGSVLTGGGLNLGAVHRYQETGVGTLLWVCISLGVAAGVVLMVRFGCPLPLKWESILLLALCIVCVGLSALGETGRRLVALLAGIAFPTAACLRTFPAYSNVKESGGKQEEALPLRVCVQQALRAMVLASGITTLGIISVVGLLATRPFMLRANQFLGIKAQHAIPLFLVAFVALIGGTILPKESWERYKTRVRESLHTLSNEPARFGTLLLGLVALAVVVLVVARTGNDAGVGVSGLELKARSLLDRVLPVRPRTKEFLLGHPAFILGVAWWLRGRRKIALPCFVVGSLGQVSLLNTFCHIHTPLVLSVWRDGLGVIIGSAIGIVIFVLSEFALPIMQKRRS